MKADEMPPDGLSERSRALWGRMTGRCRSVGRRLMLEQALRALDRADEFRALVNTQGLTTTTTTTGAVHLNPLVKAEREARGLFSKIWLALHLDWDAAVDGG